MNINYLGLCFYMEHYVGQPLGLATTQATFGAYRGGDLRDLLPVSSRDLRALQIRQPSGPTTMEETFRIFYRGGDLRDLPHQQLLQQAPLQKRAQLRRTSSEACATTHCSRPTCTASVYMYDGVFFGSTGTLTLGFLYLFAYTERVCRFLRVALLHVGSFGISLYISGSYYMFGPYTTDTVG